MKPNITWVSSVAKYRTIIYRVLIFFELVINKKRAYDFN